MDQPPAPAGWQWVIDDAPKGVTQLPAGAPAPVNHDGRLFEFTSHIAGRNAKVRLYPDRLEWDRGDRMSTKAKNITGAATLGMSYLATGFVQKRDTEMVMVKSITSVKTKKHVVNTTLQVVVSGNTIEMTISHREAGHVKRELLALMGGTHPSLAAPAPAPAAPVAAPSSGGHSIAELADLHRQGVLTDAEFSAAKARALGL